MTDKIEFSRVWSMPNKETFSIPPIRDFVLKYLKESKISIDPFARNSKFATYTNDLNPETNADYHIDAADFLNLMIQKEIHPDIIILDPPYSCHQATITYQGYGNKRVIALTPVYDFAAKLLNIGGYILNFGFNSNGLGKKRGFQIKEIMLVACGGHHNDYICMAEKKVN